MHCARVWHTRTTRTYAHRPQPGEGSPREQSQCRQSKGWAHRCWLHEIIEIRTMMHLQVTAGRLLLDGAC